MRDFERASHLFEDAAARTAFAAPRDAAYRYMFAAKYAANDKGRVLLLLEKAHALFDRVGEQESAADMLMEMAAQAEKAESSEASGLFRQAAVSFIELMKSALLDEHEELDRDLLGRLREKLNLCLSGI